MDKSLTINKLSLSLKLREKTKVPHLGNFKLDVTFFWQMISGIEVS